MQTSFRKSPRNIASDTGPLCLADLMLTMVAALMLVLAATLQDQRKVLTSIDEMEIMSVSTEIDIPNNNLVLSIEKNGRVMIGQEIILVDDESSSSSLSQRIAERASASDKILLSADQQAPYGSVARVEFALQDAKIPYIRIFPKGVSR